MKTKTPTPKPGKKGDLVKPELARKRPLWITLIKWGVIAAVACAAIGVATIALVFWITVRACAEIVLPRTTT